jgi:hypothetical protein
VLAAEIIYSGTLLIMFINNMTDKPKDYSILFISIMIAWQILVMDLIFRAGYEDREKEDRFKELEEKIELLHKGKGHSEGVKALENGENMESRNRL